jgi:hypothetical protein
VAPTDRVRSEHDPIPQGLRVITATLPARSGQRAAAIGARRDRALRLNRYSGHLRRLDIEAIDVKRFFGVAARRGRPQTDTEVAGERQGSKEHSAREAAKATPRRLS